MYNGQESLTIEVFMYLTVSAAIRKSEQLIIDPRRVEGKAPVRPHTRFGIAVRHGLQ